ncbi:alpha/beta hydrolase [Candidatus Parcubacteria bacterium]|nr:alpha/beta hydrolase [Candidatus Parcubacteria bacterium]
MQVVVDNLLVSYSKLGTGKKIILCLHGWADRSETFDKLANKLKDNYSLVLIDLPGFGGSQAPPTIWSIPDYSVFIKNFLNKLKIKPYAAIGHSNGGAIAVYGTAHQHLVVQKLILLAPSGIRSGNSAKKLLYKALAKPAKVSLKPLPKSVQGRIKERVYAMIGSDLFAAVSMQETFKNIVNFDIQNDAARVKIPVLLLYGDKDTFTPVRYGKILSGKINNSKLEIISGAAHFLHHEQPELIAEKARSFLNESDY